MTVTVFVRHQGKCQYVNRPHRSFVRDCNCVKWLRWSVDKRQHRQTTGCRVWSEAEDKRAAQEALLKDSGLSFNKPQTIHEAFTSFLGARRDEGCGPGTVKKLNTQIGRFVAFLDGKGRVLPGDITSADVLEYRSTWTEPSGLTRQLRQKNVRSFLRSCCGTNLPDILRALKAIKLSKADVERLEPQPFSEEEIAKLLAQIPVSFSGEQAARLTVLIRTQISTGLAIRDAVQLERGSLVNGWLRIKRQKTGRPVEQKLNEALGRELLSVAGPRFIFWNSTSTAESAVIAYLGDIRKLMQESGLWIKGNTSHRFRDTAVDFWIGAGCSLLEVAAMLGDTVPIVEKHYRKLLSARMQDRLAKIPSREW